jgi:hypothetical protein
LRGVIQIVGYLAGILVIGALLLDEGQVVTLLTEEDGREYETHLWIADLDGRLYIRANRPESEWWARIQADPDVGLRWGDGIGEEVEFYTVRRVNDATLQKRVESILARKHGFADRVRSALTDDDESIVMELVPAEALPGSMAERIHEESAR